MIDDLKTIRNHLSNLEATLYSGYEYNADGDKLELSIDRLMGDLQFVILDIEKLEVKVKKEQDLRNENETLHALYTEYTTVRDLIGSEE